MKIWFPLALVAGLSLLLVRSAYSINPVPSPPPVCDDVDCGPPLAVDPTPTPTPPPPPASPEENIPVVITDGGGTETHAQIARGTMVPTGIPFNQPVTVSLSVSSQVPGTPVQVGLFDGGQIALPTNMPTADPVVVQEVSAASVDALTVLADQTIRFDFQPGGVLGLYRALVTVGGKQYLVQLYATRRQIDSLPPAPLPSPTPD